MWNSFYDLWVNFFDLTTDAFVMNLKLLLLTSCIFLCLLFMLLSLLVINFISIKVILWFVPCGKSGKLHVAFFHPYCNAGGGGERVLWTCIQALHQRDPHIECYIYTGDTDATPQEIMDNVFLRFNIQLEKKPTFIYLRTRKVVEAKYYPFFTILMQSLGSVVLGAEALFRFRPIVYVDTMGYAFTYPLFRFLGGCSVASYTHYPTISSDMLDRVSNRTPTHNNRTFICQSSIFSTVKLGYYNLFALVYGLVGSSAHVVMVNSSWTKGHISSLWKYGKQPHIVFPPCDTAKFSGLPLIPDEEKDIKSIVSIGQFRPEKNYPLQLRSFRKLLKLVSPEMAEKLRLVLIGGLRNEEDEKRVVSLKCLAADLDIEDKVVWKVNASFSELLQEVQKGTVGIHTMWNEHFGIGVVESMAGGLIMIAHDSGGPQMDIVTSFQGELTGFLASTEESYALKIKDILNFSSEAKFVIRKAARTSIERFSEKAFRNNFISCVQPLLDSRRTE